MKIYLRPIELKDGPSIVRWRNDDSVKAHCLTRPIVTIESNEEFFHKNIETGKYKQYIVERISEDFGVVSYQIATIYFKDIDEENKRCELCLFTSNDEEWNSESQIIAVKMMLEKAFSEFGMHKVYSYVFPKFPDEIDLLEKAGFHKEATLISESINAEGKYEDVIRMCAFNKALS